MTNDEAFIRAIVDGRGDDTPRFVYADWLDDRSDPRGPYLRAEHAWAKTGKGEKKLRTLAAALDAVWVARVSRPPLGVCCDAIVIRDALPPVTAADIDTVEAKLKVPLPAEHRALLLNHNGGNLAYGQPGDVEGRYGWYVPSEVESFNPVRPIDPHKQDGLGNLLEAGLWTQFSQTIGSAVLKDYVPFAHGGEGDLYLLGVRGKAAGRVAFFGDFTHNARDPNGLDLVAKSLGEFLASIIAEAPEWFRHTRNGDLAGLRAWLDEGGDPNEERPHPHLEDVSPLSVAVSIGNLQMVRELVARGAKVDEEAKRLSAFVKGPTGRAIKAALAAAKKPKKK